MILQILLDQEFTYSVLKHYTSLLFLTDPAEKRPGGSSSALRFVYTRLYVHPRTHIHPQRAEAELHKFLTDRVEKYPGGSSGAVRHT